jgi:carbonic anhydrase
MTITDSLLANAQRYTAAFRLGARPCCPLSTPRWWHATRGSTYGLLNRRGRRAIIRNAGGGHCRRRGSLTISQRLLGTTEIVLIHHTDCGMQTFTEDGFRGDLEAETGLKPTWAAETFTDVDTDVRQSIARIRADPFIPHKASVRGFVYEVETGVLREVVPEGSSA